MHPSIPELLALVDDYETSKALALIDEMASDLADDAEQTIATMREIATLMRAKYEDEYVVRSLWVALGVASGEIAQDIAVELAIALEAEADDEGFARLHDELARRYVGDPATELRVRVDIAAKLKSWRECAFIVRNLRAAEELSTADVERLAIATSLLAHVAGIGRGARDAKQRDAAAAYLRGVGAELDGAVARCVVLANKLAGDPSARAAVIRADIEISRADPILAHRHASRAFELARAIADHATTETASRANDSRTSHATAAASTSHTTDAASDRTLLEDAVHAFAELLYDAELFERADEVASTLEGTLPVRVGGAESVLPHGDEGAWSFAGVDTLALLEDLRRRRGVLADPPPEAFVPPPIDPADAEAMRISELFSSSKLADGLVEYFTRDANPATAIPRVVSPEKVREWSHGQVKTIADLESQLIFGPVRSYTCGCGRFVGAKYRGVVCHRCGVEVIDRVTRSYRTGHIVLPEPVLHPWHASTIAALLDKGVRETQTANANEILEELRPLDYDILRLAYEVEDRRANDPRLPVLNAIRDSAIRPTWFVLEMLPVWPPDATAFGEREAVRRAYIEVLDGVDLRTAVNRLFSTIAKQIVAA